jgi:feruloyl esterase
MGHCAGGIGPNSFGNNGIRFNGNPEQDVISALEAWIEKGIAPERLVGTGRAVDDPEKILTRPLCPFPQVARYSGSGDPLQAANFRCAVSEP